MQHCPHRHPEQRPERQPHRHPHHPRLTRRALIISICSGKRNTTYYH